MRHRPKTLDPGKSSQNRLRLLGLVLFLSVGAVREASAATIAWTDLGHSWSLWKWIGYGVTVGLAWLVCSRLYFDRLIDHRRSRPVWPRDAFSRSMWLFIIIVCAAFIGWFHTALGKQRFIPSLLPRWGGIGLFLNNQWLGILIGVSGLTIASIFYQYNKHTSSHQRPSPAGR